VLLAWAHGFPEISLLLLLHPRTLVPASAPSPLPALLSAFQQSDLLLVRSLLAQQDLIFIPPGNFKALELLHPHVFPSQLTSNQMEIINLFHDYSRNPQRVKRELNGSSVARKSALVAPKRGILNGFSFIHSFIHSPFSSSHPFLMP